MASLWVASMVALTGQKLVDRMDPSLVLLLRTITKSNNGKNKLVIFSFEMRPFSRRFDKEMEHQPAVPLYLRRCRCWLSHSDHAETKRI